jgi:hypothetical protein
MIAPRVNPKHLPFYFNFECTNGTHPRVSTKMYVFADEVVLLGESREELNGRLETWNQALEVYDFRLSRSKTKYMEYNNFSKRRSSSTLKVKVWDHIILQVTQFKYLGSVHSTKWQRNKSICKSSYSSWVVEIKKSLKCFMW